MRLPSIISFLNLECFHNAFRAGHYKDLTETGNRARKVSGTQGNKLASQEYLDCTRDQPMPGPFPVF